MNEGNMDLTGENLVFIVGCPRSGTTWLRVQLLQDPDKSQMSDLLRRSRAG